MDLIRDAMKYATERYVSETQRRENFVFPTPDMNNFQEYTDMFAAFELRPEEAVKVILDFDKDPSKLSPADLHSRIKMLAFLEAMLDDPEIAGKFLETAGMNMNDKENVKASLTLIKRIIVLLMLEATYSNKEQSSPILENYEDTTIAPTTVAPTTAAPTKPIITTSPSNYVSPHKIKKGHSVQNIINKFNKAKKTDKKKNMIIGGLIVIIIGLAVMLFQCKKSHK